MAKPFDTLASDSLRIAGKVPLNANNLVKAVSLAVDEEVVLAMPVDTAKTRSGWAASLIAPHEGEIEPYFPGRHQGIGETANAEAAIQQARNVISQRRPGPGSVYLTNNTPYIGVINSPQVGNAPISTVIATAILKGISRIKVRKLVSK